MAGERGLATAALLALAMLVGCGEPPCTRHSDCTLGQYCSPVASCAPRPDAQPGALADAEAGPQADAEVPADAAPDAEVPADAIPDAAAPDAAIPDAAIPDAAIPDAAIPDAEGATT
jgi:hypothetical protein